MDKHFVTAIKRVFQTDDGKVLMEFLERRFYDNRIHNETMAREVGHRDVVLQLKQIQESKHE